MIEAEIRGRRAEQDRGRMREMEELRVRKYEYQGELRIKKAEEGGPSEREFDLPMQIPHRRPNFAEPVINVEARAIKKAKRSTQSERGSTRSTKNNNFELSSKLKKIADSYDVKVGKAHCMCGGYTPKMSAFNKHPLRVLSPEKDHCACNDNSITPYGRVGRPASAPKRGGTPAKSQRSCLSPKKGEVPPSERKPYLTKFEEEVLRGKSSGNKSPTRVLWELDQSSNIHNLTLQQKATHKIGSTYEATFKEKNLYETAKYHNAVNKFMQSKRAEKQLESPNK
jgi:hypothetical protein